MGREEGAPLKRNYRHGVSALRGRRCGGRCVAGGYGETHVVFVVGHDGRFCARSVWRGLGGLRNDRGGDVGVWVKWGWGGSMARL